ncbi:HAMP domain-containing protein [Psychromonas sp. KJ10-10]|uniref:HAMP domain-containing protein n=1 Tax=Psychromonas sp. KJ10-10 TaxID=3391823 RepID=UPI0039B4E97D
MLNLFGNYLSKQLQQLKVASQDISKSGPGLQIPVSGDNEISELASAFNEMSSTLARNHDQLSQNKEEEEKDECFG